MTCDEHIMEIRRVIYAAIESGIDPGEILETVRDAVEDSSD